MCENTCMFKPFLLALVLAAQAPYAFPIQPDGVLYVIRFENQLTVQQFLDLARERVAIVHDDDIVFAFGPGKTDDKEE